MMGSVTSDDVLNPKPPAAILGLILIAWSPLVYGKDTKVDGADVKYPDRVEQDGTTLRLTGTGLRKKFIFNVYTVASYVAEDEKPSSASALAALDAPKRLHIVMERGVDGKTMGEAFRDAIKKNYDLGPLTAQVKQLEDYLRSKKAEEDDNIIFEHVTGEGVRVKRTGGADLMISGVPFARAVWDIYLGKENISGDIKKRLIKGL